MGYSQALEKAWNDLSALTGNKSFYIDFLSDKYEIDLAARRVLSISCNVIAREYISIILLHYLVKVIALGRPPELSGKWIDFKDLDGGDAYYPAFKKRTTDRIIKKYGRDPDSMLSAIVRMSAKRSAIGDVGMILYPLENIALLIKISRADEEFGADAVILFDANIESVFCTEDVVVLTEILVHQL